jgi:8-oxo-dGTP pyrophosphatase MutT (NUDIX family)
MITKLNNLTHYGSAGIVFWYNNMILLVKPTISKLRPYSGWCYPKGHIEDGEELNETAIREVNEELNLDLPKDFLKGKEVKELPTIIKLKGIKHYYYFEYELDDAEFEYYFNSSLQIDKENLQIDEVEDAKFIDKNEAKKLIDASFIILLKK